MRLTGPLHISCIFGLGMLCVFSAIAQADGAPEGNPSQGSTLQLGAIEVHGVQQVTRTLQAIKVALTRPYSNDPKLANVLVCRLEDAPGSHIKQQLVCGTNRILSLRRNSLQSNFTAATATNTRQGPGGSVGCYDSVCYTAAFEQLNETIASLPGHYLDQTVNGPALRKALNDTPMPAPDTETRDKAPAATTKLNPAL